MMKRMLWLLLAAAVVLCGCVKKQAPETEPAVRDAAEETRTAETAVQTVPETTEAYIATEAPEEELEPGFPLDEPIPTIRPERLDPSYVGEFLREPDYAAGEGECAEDPAGVIYGFSQDHTEACSVWCAVPNYTVTARSSSELGSQGRYTYGAEHLTDGDRNTVWVEGAADYGVGQCVEISRTYSAGKPLGEQKFDFLTLCIVNGYAENYRKWQDNSRVRTLDMYFDGEYITRLYLEDTDRPQYFDLTGMGLCAMAGQETTMRFVIAGVYPGDKYADTAITGIELEFWTPNH